MARSRAGASGSVSIVRTFAPRTASSGFSSSGAPTATTVVFTASTPPMLPGSAPDGAPRCRHFRFGHEPLVEAPVHEGLTENDLDEPLARQPGHERLEVGTAVPAARVAALAAAVVPDDPQQGPPARLGRQGQRD